MSKFSDQVLEARNEVDAAIDALEHQPVTFGGHLSREGTSTLDAPCYSVLHDDGRVMRFERFLDPADTPYATALCAYRGRWLVIPARRLRPLTGA
jgi:hypothetical protein